MNSHPKVYFGGGGYGAVQKIGGHEAGKGQAKWTKKMPSVYIGGAGISSSLVLGGGGIRHGGAVRLGEEQRKAPEATARPMKPKVEGEAIVPPKEERAEEKPREAEVEEVEAATSPKECIDDCNPPMDERGNCTNTEVGMTETEEGLADFLEAAQAVVESDGGMKPDPPANWAAESIASREETSKAEETRGVLPELPQGELVVEVVKKRRKRRGRKAKGSTEVSETERAAIQAELEAAGDAAGNDNN